MAGYIDNYTTDPTAVVDITGSPLDIFLNFDYLGDGNFIDHPVSVLEPFLSAPLTAPLSDAFDQLWSVTPDSSRNTRRDAVIALMTQEIESYGGVIEAVYVPTSGFLQALSFPEGQLFLSYYIAGNRAKFSLARILELSLSFDLELLIYYDLQNWPFLTPTASTHIWNVDLDPANAFTEGAAALAGIGQALQDKSSDIFQPFEGAADAPGPPVDITSVAAPFNSLAQQAFQAGLTKCTPTADPATRQLTIVLLHPENGVPVLRDAADESGVPTIFHPELGAATPVVSAGADVTLDGRYFPLDTAAGVAVEWTDTTVGQIRSSVVEWTLSDGTARLAAKSRTPYDGQANFVITGIGPGESVDIRVRDQDRLTFTPWSNTLHLVASGDAEAVLSLDLSATLGTAGIDRFGSFTKSVQIPETTAAGAHELWATAGQAIAKTSIQVIAAGDVPPATVDVIDPTTNLVEVVPTAYEDSAVRVRAQGFDQGGVDLFVVSSTGGTFVGTIDSDANGFAQADVEWPLGTAGARTLVARGTQNGIDSEADRGVTVFPALH